MKKFFLPILVIAFWNTPFAQSNTETVITYGSLWKYVDNGTDQGTAWRAVVFNDGSWSTGNGKFGYGITDATTTIDYGSKPGKKYITTYFRKGIFVDPSLYSSFTVNMKRDDGAIVYINGNEIYRTNLSPGSVNYATLASDATDDGYVPQTFTVNSSAFTNGVNLIAVEIHQSKANTPDMAFDLELIGNLISQGDQTPPAVTSINRQSPLSQSTNATTLTYRATFSEKVNGVDYTDFTLSTLSGSVTGTLNNQSVAAVGTSGTTFDVTVNSVSGSGTLRLDLNGANTGITDVAGNAITSGFTSGQTYIVDQASPVLTSVAIVSNNSNTSLAKPGNIVTLSFTASKPINLPTVTIATHAVTAAAGSNNSFTAAYTMTSSDAEGIVPFTINFSDLSGNPGTQVTSTTNGSSVLFDKTPPAVVSINRQSPLSQSTNATTLTYRATFSEKVNGVDYTDFTLSTLSGSVTGALNNQSVAAVGTSGTTFDVTVNSVAGSGTLRLDLNSANTGITDVAGNAILTGFTAGETYIVDQTNVALNGFTGITNLNPVSVSTNTGEKPQSKVWYYDGKYWTVLPNSGGTYLFRLDGISWTSILRLSSRTTSKADCKRVGNVVHVLLYQGTSSQMVSVEYLPATQTYQLWSRRTSTVGLTLDNGVETAAIDIDGTGRMWLASAGVADINIRWSDSPYNTWSPPVTVATGVNDDDICDIIYMPNIGKMGLLWSNQTTQRFGFKTHTDGASPSAWSADEVPASQSALNAGAGMADDHLNMAIAGDGTLYCAVKTSYDLNGYPKLALLVRRPAGTWDNLYEVSQGGSRPIVLLNDSIGKIKVIYSSVESGGDILYKESSASSISFSPSFTLIKGGLYNNSTSTKENYISDIVILASDGTNAVGVLATDGTPVSPPGIPTLVSPLNNSSNISVTPTLNWNSVSGAGSYQVQVSTASNFGVTFFDQNTINTSVAVSGLSNNTMYYWRVGAGNAAGNSGWSEIWNFTTSPATPTTTLVGYWKLDEGTGTAVADASGYGNNGSTVGNPVWVTGVSGQALRLNGTSQYVSVPNSLSLNPTAAITLSAWIKPEKVGTQYIIKKAVLDGTDGYELALATDGTLFFRINQKSSSNTYRVNSSSQYPTNGNTWMHIAGTYNGTVMKLYIDGVLNATLTPGSPPAIKTNGLILAIGAQSDGIRNFKGDIDDARIYNSALSDSEIQGLFTAASTAPITQVKTGPGNDNLQEAAVDNILQVYPNPSSSHATIRFIIHEKGSYDLSLYDLKGAIIAILKRGNVISSEQGSVEINRNNLPGGVYLLKLRTKSFVRTIKLVMLNNP